MAEKESFVFYASFYEALQDLKDKERLKMYDAICELALNNKETKMAGLAKTIFTLIKPQILANQKRYENGKKGGRPKKETNGLQEEKTNGFENKKTTGYEKTETKTKPNENVNVNVNENDNENVNVNENDNDNENVSDSCVDGLQEIIDFYNQNIGLITPYGIEVLEDYAKEMTADLIIYAMEISVEANVRTIQYIKGILNNWSKKGIKTLVEAKEENRKQNKKDEIEEWLNE